VAKETQIIRQDTDYAIRALLHLATVPKGKATGAEVATACSIPESFAYKVLKRMQRAGLISSRTGRAGGFLLRQEPQAISLNKVVTVMQGPLSVRMCVIEPSACELSEQCAVSSKWDSVQRDIVSFLDETTLEDLLRGFRRSGESRRKGA
jgi:Rrf2 family protein